MKLNIKEKFNKFINCLFVKDYKCIVCGKEIVKNDRYCICKECMAKLPFILKPCEKCGESIVSGNICLNCKDNKPKINRNYSVFDYDFPINKLIKDLKYKNKKYLAPYLSHFIIDKYIESGIEVDYIVPVPISKNGLKKRGFNQAYLLAKEFQKELDIDIEENLVERTIDRPNQTTLNRIERLNNLKGVFKIVDKTKVKGKTILIIDDVYTTGATMNEIASVLFKAKAKAVYGITLAHSKYEIQMEDKIDNRSK